MAIVACQRYAMDMATKLNADSAVSRTNPAHYFRALHLAASLAEWCNKDAHMLRRFARL